MKNLIPFFLFLLFTSFNNLSAQAHFESALGKIENGKPVLTLDQKAVAEKWAGVINEKSKLKLNFDELSIKNNGSQYVLMARDNRSNATSAILLVAEKGFLYEKAEKQSSITVTCSGCTSTGLDSAGQCQPTQPEAGLWACTSCTQGTCTKTVTRVEAKAILDKVKNQY